MSFSRIAVLIAALYLLAGCATNSSTFEEGRTLIESGNVEAGLALLRDAARADPGNPRLQAYYLQQREIALQRYIALADNARGKGMLEEAAIAYRHVLAIDPENLRAKMGLDAIAGDAQLRTTLREAELLFEKGEADAAYAKAKDLLAKNPLLRGAQNLVRRIEERNARAAMAQPELDLAASKPITVEFRDASVRQVFEIISKHSGLNFVFDREVKPDLRTTVYLRNTMIKDVIRFVLTTNQLEQKVLNENTLLIYPNTPAKVRDYRELLVRSFYLSNADVKQTANMIRSLVKTKDMYIDEKLNLLVIRDTPEAVRMAERLVANQDLAEPEVMLEVEVLEVGTSLLQQLGVQWFDQLGIGVVGAAGTPGTITLREGLNANSGLLRLTISDPALLLNLKKQDGRTSILANPRIRVKNREKARIHIGDKVPVITTTTTATGFVAESVNYLDVGLKLEVEPSVFLEDDVGIRVGLEVSSITNQIRSSSGTLTYQVGTRNTSTALRLKDGETQVLAGLISDEDRRNANRVPGLGELPVLGRLFSSTGTNATKTEIVLLITPRVVRNLIRPDIRFEEFPSGTESTVGSAPLVLPSVRNLPPNANVPSLRAVGPPRPPQPAPETAPAPSSPVAPPAPGVATGQPPGDSRSPAGSSTLPSSPPSPPASGAPSPPQSSAPASPTPGASSDTGNAASATVALRAPTQISPGQEITATLEVQTQTALRSGSLNLAFDPAQLRFTRAEPGSLFSVPGSELSFQASAPSNAGRVTVNFASKVDIQGSGTATTLYFQAVGGGTSTLRLDTLSATDSNNRTLPLRASQ